jgi:cyclohexa-1,5-dienecarbonyl-CoA hydratase
MTVTNRVDGSGVGTLVFSNPPLNILTQALLADIRAGLAELAEDRSLRVLLLRAEGDHFSAGADVGEHLPPRVETLIPEFLETVRAIAEFPVPVIAVVRGRCLGGGFEIALAADWIFAGESATFGQPEIRLGVIAPAACALLPRRCAPGVAAEILFTGDSLGAGRALVTGLVHRVVPDSQVLEESLAMAGRVARYSAATVRATKRALRAGHTTPAAALDGAGAVYLTELVESRDAIEGLRAFLEKRSPSWTHA